MRQDRRAVLVCASAKSVESAVPLDVTCSAAIQRRGSGGGVATAVRPSGFARSPLLAGPLRLVAHWSGLTYQVGPDHLHCSTFVTAVVVIGFTLV
jgi:hypothetical protein